MDDPTVIQLEEYSKSELALLSMTALAEIGPATKPAVPKLTTLLEGDLVHEASHYACSTLRKIGKSADAAIPALVKYYGRTQHSGAHSSRAPWRRETADRHPEQSRLRSRAQQVLRRQFNCDSILGICSACDRLSHRQKSQVG